MKNKSQHLPPGTNDFSPPFVAALCLTVCECRGDWNISQPILQSALLTSIWLQLITWGWEGSALCTLSPQVKYRPTSCCQKFHSDFSLSRYWFFITENNAQVELFTWIKEDCFWSSPVYVGKRNALTEVQAACHQPDQGLPRPQMSWHFGHTTEDNMFNSS